MSLSPGTPALIVLAVATLAAFILGAHHRPIPGGERNICSFLAKAPPESRAVTTAAVALPFWLWALYKVVTSGDKDLGVVSFALVVASAGNVVRSPGAAGAPLALLVANALVSLNYLYPLLAYDLPSTFRTYLVVGVVYWSVAAGWNWTGRTMRPDHNVLP